MAKPTKVLTKEKTLLSFGVKVTAGVFTLAALAVIITAITLATYLSGNAALVILSVGNIFSSDQLTVQSYPLDISTSVYRFSVDADISFKNDDALVRVILVASQDKEYLVYEGYSAISNQNSFSITDSDCDETCVLSATTPTFLKIQTQNSSIAIKNINFTDTPELTKSLDANAIKAAVINKKIQSINSKNLGWTAGITSVGNLSYADKKTLFSAEDVNINDLPDLQGIEYYKSGVFHFGPVTKSAVVTTSNVTLPDSWDWQNVHSENWMTSVKNQYEPHVCHSCWAFCTLGPIEAKVNLDHNKHLNYDLSEQELISCSLTGDGCSGGSPFYVLNNLYFTHNGIVDEECYPYSGTEGFCQNICENPNTTISISTKDIEADSVYFDNGIGLNEEVMKTNLIKKGPAGFTIESWHHCVTLVGWQNDFETGKTVWIYKNSWGTDWGEQGYGRIVLGTDRVVYYFLNSTPVNVNGVNLDVNCIDKDNDKYCNWGISEQPPAGTVCPVTCEKDDSGQFIKDCDDSNNELGPFISENNLNCSIIAPPSLPCTASGCMVPTSCGN